MSETRKSAEFLGNFEKKCRNHMKRYFNEIKNIIGALFKGSDVIRSTDVALQKRIFFNREIRNEIQ